ncbi:hypothetical protein A2116_01325 [Candidatus Jorgensenbacteria bacterium GWA1_49_17]|uniref:Uncharacterized protein n=2 Tax=Parcubacteria group TaxID=1794811 RepID=A0A0G1U357_9BACT|nr:MAG: hypothetical protein UV62_C0029G0005 [Parcubacteria group bacterium GW2011_GWC1_43_11]KKU88511.1 MAG: hypothetical protein UY19_C0028G0005 [Candidatus Wolfebacteria bacterium GW2011_GWA2_47_9b]OGG40708.1 MAG: hypothetical protein A2116_01325 [Candidatus Jorgensenbacteria bacterium GWA1_49_17]
MRKSTNKKSYLDLLKERKTDSRVYFHHQSVGLELAETLEDKGHKSLYMKLAKDYDAQALLELAKDVAMRSNVQNKGAYFMKLLPSVRKTKKQ